MELKCALPTGSLELPVPTDRYCGYGMSACATLFLAVITLMKVGNGSLIPAATAAGEFAGCSNVFPSERYCESTKLKSVPAAR